MKCRCRVLDDQVTEVFNHYDNSSNYDYIWFPLTTLESVHREVLKLTATKYSKNAHKESKGFHGSFEGVLHLSVIVVSEMQAM